MFRSNDRAAVGRGFAVALALALPATLSAQQPPAANDNVDEIIITGSRIARPEETAMSPFAVIGEEQISLSNPTNIENFLRTSPQFAQALGSNTNNGNEGSATIDLRNLGEERTLVLVNGKRFIPYDYQGFVDLSMIPVSLIDRVEIITGGASAVYGSEAVAGVVNFILKDDFEGLEVGGGYSVTEEGDGDIYDVNITAGGNFAGGKGNLVFNVGYTKQDPISQGDRPYSAFALRSSNLTPRGSFTTPFSTIFYPELDDSGLGLDESGCAQFADDSTPVLCENTFNFNPFNLYQVPQRKWVATALGKYEINDDLEFFVRGSFANNRTDTVIAPTGTFFEPFQINVNNPLLPQATRDLLQLIEDDEDDGDGLANVLLGRRLTEVGPRISLYENTAYQFVTGLRGTVLDDQNWETFVQYGRTSRNQNFLNDNNKDLVQETLLSDDGVTCRAPASAGCIPGNYFGSGNLDPAVSNFIRLNLNEINKTDQLIFGGSLAGDLPLTIPTANRAIGYAAGVEFRREKGNNRPDDNYIRGIAPGFGASSPVDAEIEVKEVFAEVLVPLVADAPFANAINFETGIRYAKYDNQVNFATGTVENTFYNTSYKFGVDWSPIEDLTFNVMFQRAVRAPNMSEIGLPKTSGTGDLTDDPCDNDDPPIDPDLIQLCEDTGVPVGNVGAFTSIIAGQIGNFSGGNPNLDPEEADTWTAGVAWQPSFYDGLYFSVDYYDIEIEDAIIALLEQDIVNACYFFERSASGTFCQLIERSPLTGGLQGGSTVGVFRSYTNSSVEAASGIDFDFRLGFDFDGGNALDFQMLANYVIERVSKPADFLDEYDCAGLVGNTCLRPTPEWTINFISTWTTGPAKLQLLVRYLDSITQDATVIGDDSPSDYAVPTIASQTFVDLTGQYDVGDNITIRGGITNLFDRDPPIVGNDYGGTAENSGNTFPATYPSVGRGYYLGATAKF
jgi:outer membrane receptor protein involved in Fe transport